MAALTWDYVEGVSYGWKYVLGLQRSTGFPDVDKNGLPEEIPEGRRLRRPTTSEPLDIYQSWYEPGRRWFRLNGELQRTLAWHTATSVFSPFLSASFSRNMGHAYGPILIELDVCPERLLPNFEPRAKYASEEELYLPFFVLPEEIVGIQGRECSIARSRYDIDSLPPEERAKYLRATEELCAATYESEPVKKIPDPNAETLKWRSYFRNFLTNLEPNYMYRNSFHIIAAQEKFYGLLSSGLNGGPLNPPGEMTLARWRQIAREQVRGFQNCNSTQLALASLSSGITTSEKEIIVLQERIKRIPNPVNDPQDPEYPLEPPWPKDDWRLKAIEYYRGSIGKYQQQIELEKSAAAGKC